MGAGVSTLSSTEQRKERRKAITAGAIGKSHLLITTGMSNVFEAKQRLHPPSHLIKSPDSPR